MSTTTTNLGNGLTTGNSQSTTAGQTTGTLTVPPPFGFGVFGDPGAVIATPALASPPLLLGPVLYTLTV